MSVNGARLRVLKVEARRRAATRPIYADTPESESDTHETVTALLPLQLHVAGDVED